MSQDEQDAIVGRMVREKREATERLEQLRVEAKKIGSTLLTLGRSLHESPEYLAAQGQGVDQRFAHSQHQAVWPGTLISADRIMELTNAIRAEIVKISELTESLKRMGIQ